MSLLFEILDFWKRLVDSDRKFLWWKWRRIVGRMLVIKEIIRVTRISKLFSA